jgi:hypothetical protein
MLGLAAVAAMAVMAFVAASASAEVTELEKVVLCKQLENPCVNGSFPTGTIVHGTATNATLLGPPNVVCETSTVKGETTTALAHGLITGLTWAGCKEEGGGGCTVTTQHLNYLIKGELQANHVNYEALVTGTTNGRPAAQIVCPEIPGCSFGENSVLFEALHVEGVTVLDVLQTLKGEGLCFFTSGIWHAKYAVKCLNEVAELKNCYLEME